MSLVVVASVLCMLAIAAAFYLVLAEVRAPRHTASLGDPPSLPGHRESRPVPWPALRAALTRLLLRAGPRARVGGATAGLVLLALAGVGMGGIRLSGAGECPAVCVDVVRLLEHDELAAGPASPALASDSERGAVDPGIARGTSVGMSSAAGQPVTAAASATDTSGACLEAGTTPQAFGASRAGGGQRATLLTYSSRAALNADWDVERGSPFRYRGRGSCGANAVVYWSQGNILLIPAAADSTTRQALAAEFFALR